MILRRLGEAIAEQNWFIVLIEVLVVVVGIFIGLQVDDWNKARQNRIDGRQFLQRLHGDLLLADKLSSRVRERRLDRLQTVIVASDVLFNRAGRDILTEEECTAIAGISFFNINAPSLSSLDELIGTGRMEIIQDAELRTALVGLQQTRAALAAMIAVQSGSSNFTSLPSSYPELIEVTAYYDSELGEIRTRPQCNLAKMRANRTFLNKFSINADGYDAYIRDGLAPWSAQFDSVHQLVDDALGLDHRVEGNK